MNEESIKKLIQDAELSAKAVWEIDGIAVYVRDILIDNGNVTVDWFTFNQDVNANELGNKVEKLAHKIIGDTVCLSSNPFSRICSSMKNIFGSRGRT